MKLTRTIKAAVVSAALAVGMVAFAAQADAYTVNAPSNTYQYCVVQTSSYQVTYQPIVYCYSDKTTYDNVVNSYPSFIATLFGATNYNGWRLAIVSQSHCNDFPNALGIDTLVNTGWNNRVSSSITWANGCTGASAWSGPNFTGSVLRGNYGYSNNSGHVPDWSVYGASDLMTSMIFSNN